MQTVSSILALLLLLGLGGSALVYVDQAPAHDTLGSWSELVGPTLAALGIGLLGCVLAGLGAWGLWSKELKMAGQLLGIVAVVFPILAWQVVDAANVVRDESVAVVYETEVLDKYSRKNDDMLVLRSWHNPESRITLTLNKLGTGHELTLGQAALVTVHGGAFGRPYATKIEAR